MAFLQAPLKGVLIGGSGLVGGTLLHHFKTSERSRFELLSPNSKELSLRVAEDIRSYFEKVRPDFIVNCAIASIDSDARLTYEVTYLGAVHLARAARELGIPYIHLSSAAVLPSGRNLDESTRRPLLPELPHYAKAKLLAERTLEYMAQKEGLDYTNIRLAIVYGAHDHKIQGFHRLLFSIVDRSLPVLLTSRSAMHSYTNAAKLPAFVSHVLENRASCAGRTFHFVDPEPVALGQLILAIRSLLGAARPREIYVPRAIAKLALSGLARLVRLAALIGIEARLPAESLFIEDFYESQTLSCDSLRRSGFVDPDPDATIFTALPALLAYYVRRWELLNLIVRRDASAPDAQGRAALFLRSPERLLAEVLDDQQTPFLQRCSLVNAPPAADAGGRVAAALR
jgi:nucleoside-diphosphate-sugar epimerase